MSDTILMSSGFLPETLEAIRKRWDVKDIPVQRDALEALRHMKTLPVAVCIGHVANKEFNGENDLDAWQMLRGVKSLAPGLPVVISTSANSPKLIVDLVKSGAFDYVLEPHDKSDSQDIARYTEDLQFALSRAVEWRRVTMENQDLRQGLLCDDLPIPIRGISRSLTQVMELVKKVAPTSATVLITGESGTGKELVAHAIHALSNRSDKPFTALNCGSFSENLISSELLGHVKGAFTGAVTARPGLIRETGEGTLFLDEIATIQQTFQVVLLRVLEQHTARSVGAGEEYPVKCRFVAAANRSLEQMVDEGSFREDLFYRLNMFNIHIPPLRDRREDIPVLTNFFLRKASQEYGKEVTGITPEALRWLESEPWPGNVRQLRNAVERAVILSDEPLLNQRNFDADPQSVSLPPGRREIRDYTTAMAEFERKVIAEALTASKGNTSEAARRLSIKRPRLCYRIKMLGLEGNK